MTPDEFAEIRAREQAATPGPWRTHDTYVPGGGYCMTVLSGEGNYTEPRAWLPTFSNDTGSPMKRNVEADAEFMACAREDVPGLLEHLEAQYALIAEARTVARVLVNRVGIATATAMLNHYVDMDPAPDWLTAVPGGSR